MRCKGGLGGQRDWRGGAAWGGRRMWPALVAAVAAVAAGCSCGRGLLAPTEEPGTCVPYAVEECPRPGCFGTPVRICNPDGTGWGPCLCGGQLDGGADGPTDAARDAAQHDAAHDTVGTDALRDTAGSDVPLCLVPDQCGPVEICGNGLDDDCNGVIDDGCPPSCTPGDVQPCFLGPPGRRNVGACSDGTQRCEGSGSVGSWGPCSGGIWPTDEACDALDNDCNGCVDDGLPGCVPPILCPGPGDLPYAEPFTDYTIDGTDYFRGVAQSWSWTVVGGPCDQLLWATAGETSYALNGARSTTASGPTLVFHPTLSGDYTVTLTVVAANGESLSCTFIVHVEGPGFRAELCWDTTGQTDLDLHVHRPGTATPWFTTDGTSSGATNNDDCHYINCRASNYVDGSAPSWGYSRTSVDNCKGAPDDGATWAAAGYCASPRLDVDNITTPGKPENTNIDDPNDGDTFRVMVHFYGGSSTVAHPLVNVYCGGTIVATYGAAPDFVQQFNKPGDYANGSGGSMWRVVDVTTHVSGGVTTGCDLTPLHPSGSTSGYWVKNSTDLSY
jgi:hypothetical protein